MEDFEGGRNSMCYTGPKWSSEGAWSACARWDGCLRWECWARTWCGSGEGSCSSALHYQSSPIAVPEQPSSAGRSVKLLGAAASISSPDVWGKLFSHPRGELVPLCLHQGKVAEARGISSSCKMQTCTWTSSTQYKLAMLSHAKASGGAKTEQRGKCGSA